jgi:preprotein translocase subunit SecY
MNKLITTFKHIFSIEELRGRILNTVLFIAFFRLGSYIVLPGVDATKLSQPGDGGLFGLLNMFSGGALSNASVFALGIMPYISASIAIQLLTIALPYFQKMQKDGESGRKKLNQITRILTIFVTAAQGFTYLQVTIPAEAILVDPWFFRLYGVAILVGGTMFCMWLGEKITDKGIGNGISLIIFAGIAAGIPSGIRDTFNLLQNGEMNIVNLAVVLAIMLVSFWIIIFVERAFRKVPVQYAKRVVNNRVFGGQSSHLPIKINISGVMPPIFASALLGFPTTISQFIPQESPLKNYFTNVEQLFFPGKTLYNLVFVGLIVFFAYFYSTIQFKTDDVSESLKKNGGFIPGIRPGEQTAEFLNNIISRLTLVGAIYVSAICIMPAILFNYAKVPFHFGGTSLLILVGVAIDTMAQAESFMISQRLDTAYKSRGKYSGVKRF